jgi:hypothetical protein
VTVQLSSVKAGARNVRLVIALPAPLRCGRPAGSVVVELPKAEPVPASIETDAVATNGRSAGKVSVKGNAVTVAVARPAGLTCFSIVAGSLTVVFAPKAGLRNPATPGSYVFRIRRAARVYSVPIRIVQ